jgi:hypothetical protein
MRSFLLALVAGTTLSIAVTETRAAAVLYQPAYALDDKLRGPAVPYEPQPGDIYMSTDTLWLARVGHRMAFSGPPHHSGIVFARPDGRMAVLESGPFNGLYVETLDLDACVCGHEKRTEKVWIRRRRTPLTPEQSRSLTEWALAQEGKRFAIFRLLAQVTLLRSRGYYRTGWLGGPHGERTSYFCSELVMESCVHVGLVSKDDARPCATYPRDLFFDNSDIPFLKQHLHVIAEGWYPPARCVCSRPGDDVEIMRSHQVRTEESRK